jgi:hypothetical protein
MDLTPYVASVEESLVAAASAGDEDTRRTADALSAALEPATRLALMEALSELALEVTETLGDRVVELRLETGQVRVAVTSAPSPDEAFFAAEGEAGAPSRFTLRLPEGLKAQAEGAAAAGGVSLNTWLIRAIQEALRGDLGQRAAGRRSDSTAQRLRGWVQS